MAGYIGVEYFEKQSMHKELQTCQTNNAQLVASMTEISKKTDSLKTGLDQAAIKNNAIETQVKNVAIAISKKPLPVTCPDALKELKELNNTIVKEWNK